MAEVEITHTPAEGTLLTGTCKGDGVSVVLRSLHLNWWWGRSIGCYYIKYSRDRAPKLYAINRTAEALREAGHEVTVSVETGPRDIATAEADRADRMDDRADALTAKAARLGQKSDALWNRAETLADARNGSPILIGHHSEKRARRDQTRIENWSHTSVELGRQSASAASRAATASEHMDRRTHPHAIASRIVALEKDIRKIRRRLDGSKHTFGGGYVETYAPATGLHRDQLTAELEHVTAQLEYWRGQLDAAKEAGEWREWKREDFKRGDLIKAHGRWRKVVRANKVTVSTESGYSWNDKVAYRDIRGHRAASDEN